MDLITILEVARTGGSNSTIKKLLSKRKDLVQYRLFCRQTLQTWEKIGISEQEYDPWRKGLSIWSTLSLKDVRPLKTIFRQLIHYKVGPAIISIPEYMPKRWRIAATSTNSEFISRLYQQIDMTKAKPIFQTFRYIKEYQYLVSLCSHDGTEVVVLGLWHDYLCKEYGDFRIVQTDSGKFVVVYGTRKKNTILHGGILVEI